MKKILKKDGFLIVSNVRDKFSNPTFYFMEWVVDWSLVYRTDQVFKNIFVKAGFSEEDIEVRYEQQGVLQYIKAHNN